MGEAIDIFRLSGMKYPIHILASTFSTVSLAFNKKDPTPGVGLAICQKRWFASIGSPHSFQRGVAHSHRRSTLLFFD